MGAFADRWHRRAGLLAAGWLLVLGLTGFLLDHRDEWRWLWRPAVTGDWLPQTVTVKARKAAVRFYRIGPGGHRLAGGRSGAWWSVDGGRTWHRSISRQPMPMVRAVAGLPDGRLWFATDDGLWCSNDFGRHIEPAFLRGVDVTAVARGAGRASLLLVTGRSQVLGLNTLNGRTERYGLKPVAAGTLPVSIDLSRLVHDLHFGRGVFASPWSLLWSDLAGLALVILPLSGLLFWYLPRRWRRLAKPQRPPARQRRLSMRWLFRLHAPLIGLLAVVPILYLSLTGILLDHRQDLRGWMKSVIISRAGLPPVYDMRGWQGEIRDIVGYPGQPNRFSLASRFGIFTTRDGGHTWRREVLGKGACFIVTLRRVGDSLAAGGMGCANHLRGRRGSWRPVRHSGHMPSDISTDGVGNWYWVNRKGVRVGKPGQALHPASVTLPAQEMVPWYFVIEALHSGLLFHAQWKWLNDLFAILAIVLVLTGLVRWWRVKWI